MDDAPSATAPEDAPMVPRDPLDETIDSIEQICEAKKTWNAHEILVPVAKSLKNNEEIYINLSDSLGKARYESTENVRVSTNQPNTLQQGECGENVRKSTENDR